MAQYKVPQDVEADDKLIGPFSFRQFVYLLIAAGLIAAAVGLFQLFPLLAIIPLPPVLLLLALALPLKKDQPMETYLAAIVSYYLKPRRRLWTPGQSESTIKISAPKIVDDNRKRDITGEEATHRLSFLADIMDTGGYAIKGASGNPMREDLLAEANATSDMFDNYAAMNLNRAIDREKAEKHEEVIKSMREAIERNEDFGMKAYKEEKAKAEAAAKQKAIPPTPIEEKASVVLRQPKEEKANNVVVMPTPVEEKPVEKVSKIKAKPSIIELASNPDFSIATIAKEANRINRKDEDEVFISLH